MILYLLGFCVCYGIQFAGVVLLVEILSVPKAAAQIIGEAIYAATNFLFNRTVTFR